MNATLPDRARDALLVKQESDAKKAVERSEKNFDTSRGMLIARAKELLNVDVQPDSVTRSEKYTAEVEIDGLRFCYKASSEWRQLYLISTCAECGNDDQRSIHNLAHLGQVLTEPKSHKCPELEPAATSEIPPPPLPTVEAALLEALQNYVWAKSFQG